MTDLVEILEQKANDLRIHSITSTAAAGSGHPTTCMSCAEIISTLFFHAMRYDPKDPNNPKDTKDPVNPEDPKYPKANTILNLKK